MRTWNGWLALYARLIAKAGGDQERVRLIAQRERRWKAVLRGWVEPSYYAGIARSYSEAKPGTYHGD